jgi:transposase
LDIGTLKAMPTTAYLATALVPSTTDLQLENVTIGVADVTATLLATRSEIPCPLCGSLSGRIHSRYQRTLADLPWSQHHVRLVLSVRKFFCDVAACSRRIFTERLPGVVAPYARRTTRLTDILRLLAFALGGEAGARLVERLGLTTSPATLLRLIRRTAPSAPTTPRVLGVDDWAFRRGHRYGTILVDLEDHRVIDLLSERQADQFAAWLSEHPDVAVVSRDRAQVYADGARRGAPHAVQVADRFHLLKNLGEALERLLLHERTALQAAAGQASVDPAPLKTYGEDDRVPWQERAEQVSQQKHAPKLAQYAEIVRLHAAGTATKHIAEVVGVSRPTVYRYLRLDGPPERKRPYRSRHLLTTYEPYLRQRWTEGCRTKSQLLREVRSKGYTHSASSVYRYLKRVEWEEVLPRPTSILRSDVPSPRHVASLLVQRPERQTDDDRAYLDRLCEQAPTIANAYALTKDFAGMLRERHGQHLDNWLRLAKDSGIKELAAYARGLETDYAAVRAGLELEWSNGQTEGQVNKLKLLKRQMYGRANFDLLRLRVLHAA